MPDLARPAGSIAPASWLEWVYSIYPPDKYTWRPTARGIVLVQGAVVTFGNPINIDIPLFVTEIRTGVWVTATGAAPGLPWALDVLESGESWFGGPWLARLIGQVDGQTAQATITRPFENPREVPANTQLQVAVNNGLVAAAPAITVQALIYGYEPRLRQNPVRRAADGSALLPGK